MKIFKSIDDRFAELGFVKLREDKYGAEYERNDHKYNYTHKLCFLYKSSGQHIVQSYDKALFDEKGIGNTCVGLTMYETVLCLAKMKQMGWKARKFY